MLSSFCFTSTKSTDHIDYKRRADKHNSVTMYWKNGEYFVYNGKYKNEFPLNSITDHIDDSCITKVLTTTNVVYRACFICSPILGLILTGKSPLPIFAMDGEILTIKRAIRGSVKRLYHINPKDNFETLSILIKSMYSEVIEMSNSFQDHIYDDKDFERIFAQIPGGIVLDYIPEFLDVDYHDMSRCKCSQTLPIVFVSIRKIMLKKTPRDERKLVRMRHRFIIDGKKCNVLDVINKYKKRIHIPRDNLSEISHNLFINSRISCEVIIKMLTSITEYSGGIITDKFNGKKEESKENEGHDITLCHRYRCGNELPHLVV